MERIRIYLEEFVEPYSKFNKGNLNIKINIENVRPGTIKDETKKVKYAIIGRDMKQIEEAADILKSSGADIEILDDKWLGGKMYRIEEYEFTNSMGKKITIEGDIWNVDKCMEDMKTTGNHIRIDGRIINEVDIIGTPMYKFNKLWIEDIKSNGYEIIDIGNPRNKEGKSIFYEMEKSTLNFK